MTAPTPETSPATKLSPPSESSPDGPESTTADAAPEWPNMPDHLSHEITDALLHLADYYSTDDTYVYPEKLWKALRASILDHFPDNREADK